MKKNLLAILICGNILLSGCGGGDFGFGPEVENNESELNQARQESLDILNSYRSSGIFCGKEGQMPAVGNLVQNDILNQTAYKHAKDMADRDFYAHKNPDGLDPYQRAVNNGYPSTYVGENIAKGHTDVRDVMKGWKGSDGHCSNMMHSKYTEYGFAYYVKKDTAYWVQVFGNPKK